MSVDVERLKSEIESHSGCRNRQWRRLDFMLRVTGARFYWPRRMPLDDYFLALDSLQENNKEISEALIAQWEGLAPVVKMKKRNA